jgi:hopanoid-associated phosphorylase
MAFEAAIAGRKGEAFICCGQAERLGEALEIAFDDRCAGVLSFGIAAGLDPKLPPGSAVVASVVVSRGDEHPVDERLSQALLSHDGRALSGAILGVDAPVLDAREKKRLFEKSGAVALDMESHLAARFAANRKVKFAALRVIADPAERTIPPVALLGMRPDGALKPMAVLSGLVRSPTQIAPLARLAYEMWSARRGLVRVRRRLGAGFGLFDVG